MGIKQKEAVYAAFISEVGQGKTAADMTSALRDRVKESVAASLHTGEVDWNSPDKSPEACLVYAGQLISNWTKKDERISGLKYAPVAPRGPQVKDEKLKALISAHASAKVLGRTDVTPQLEALITQRREELKAAKAKTKVLSADELAATLAELGIS